MANVLDVGFLKFFTPIFTFLFVLVLSYAMLQKTKLMGENKNVHWVVSLCLAVLILFSTKSTELINFVTPWFVILLVFLALIFMTFMFFGESQNKIWDIIGGHRFIYLLMILIIVIAIGQVFGDAFSPYDEGDGTDDGQSTSGQSLKTIANPKVIGAVLILFIAAFSIQYISKKAD